MNIKKIITGIMASTLMACSLSAFSTTAANNYSPKYKKGDLNGDNLINETDRVLLSSYAVGNITLNDAKAVKAADVNWDNEIDIMDVICMNKHLAGVKPGIHTGDVDGKNKVTSADAELLGKYLLGTATITEKGKIAADVNGDGDIDSTDLLLLNKYLYLE